MRQILKIAFLFSLLVAGGASSSFAQRALELSYAAGKDVKLYHSYKAKTLTLSIQEKPSAAQACRNNRYVFYDYGKDRLFEFSGGNLLIARDHNTAILSSNRAVHAVSKDQLKSFSKKLSKIATDLKASSSLLENTKITSENKKTACWQQVALVDFKDYSLKGYPMILSNLCLKGNCTQFKFEKTVIAKFWVTLKKNQYTQVNLKPKNGVYIFGKSKKPFYLKPSIAENAYLENLLKKNSGKLNLSKSKRNQSYVSWEKQKGKLSIKLVRTGVEVRGAQELAKTIAAYNKNGQYNEAISLSRFVLWLDPDSVEAGYEKLKAIGLSGNQEEFFHLLRKGMNYKKRIESCRKLHLDKDLQPLWKQSSFIKRFKETCP